MRSACSCASSLLRVPYSTFSMARFAADLVQVEGLALGGLDVDGGGLAVRGLLAQLADGRHAGLATRDVGLQGAKLLGEGVPLRLALGVEVGVASLGVDATQLVLDLSQAGTQLFESLHEN
jgi:hypothetical protein